MLKKLHHIIQSNQEKILVLLDQVIVSGGNFLLAIVLIRLLGLETYGLFAMLWLGLLFVLSLHQAFITKPMMTLAIDKIDSERSAYFISLWQIQVIGLLAIGLPIIGISQLPVVFPSWMNFIPFLVVITSCYLLQEYLKKTFFINKKYTSPLLMDALLYGIVFTGLIVLWFTNTSTLKNTLWVLLSAYGVSVVAGCGLRVMGWHHAHTSHSTLHTLKIHYHFSSWLLGTSILQWLSGNFFLVAAASILGTTAVGAVRMAQNLVGLCNVLFLAMENLVPAEAAQHFLKNGTTGLTNYLKKSSQQLGGIVLLVLVGMAMATPWLIPMLYGNEYMAYSYVVWGYCLLYVFVFLGYPVRYYFRTVHTTKPIFIAYILGGGFSLIAAFPLVKMGGLMGLLFGLIVSQILTLVFYYFYIRFTKSTLTNVIIKPH